MAREFTTADQISIAMTLQAKAVGLKAAMNQLTALEKKLQRIQKMYSNMKVPSFRKFADLSLFQAGSSRTTKSELTGDQFISQDALSRLQRAKKTVSGKEFDRWFESIQLQPTGMKQYAGGLREVDDMLGDVNQQAQTFDMASLGLMFAGMQLQRTFGGLFRTLSRGYGEAQSANSKYNEQMSELNARFEFFKFLLFDAFANSAIFQTLIGWLNSILDYFIGLPQPVKTFIVALTGLLALLGTIMFAVFSIDLAVKAWSGSLLIGSLKSKLIPALAVAWVWAKAISITLAQDAVVAVGSLAAKLGAAGAAGTVAGSIVGIVAGLLFVGQLIKKASQFGWDWGAAFGYVAGQTGILFGQILRGLNWLISALSKAVTALGGLIVDGIAGAFRQAVNTVIDQALPILNFIDAIVGTNLAGKAADMKFDRVWNTDQTAKALSSVEDFFAGMDESLVARNDELRRQLGMADRVYGVDSGYTDLLAKNSDTVAELNRSIERDRMASPGAQSGVTVEQTNNVTIPSSELQDFVINQLNDTQNRMATEVNFDSS